jgi:hypothetical protein
MRNSTLPLPPVKPFGVDDLSYDIIMAAARPLAPCGSRDAFLENVAQELRRTGVPEGEGALYRLLRELQRKYWDPPLEHGSKYSRRG